MGTPLVGAKLKTLKEWHQKVRKVMYWLSINVSSSMIMHIHDVEMPKEAWDTLVKLYSTSTTMCKMQLKQELHNMQRKNLNINEYSMKVEVITQFRTFIGVCETFLYFQGLDALLLLSE